MTDRPVADREPLSAIRAAADYLEDADDGTRPYARVLAERLRALDAARTHPDEAGLLREALERIARSTREEGGRCVWCGNASLATYHHDYCPKEIARVALDLWPAVPVASLHTIHTPVSRPGDTNAWCSVCGFFPLPLDGAQPAVPVAGAEEPDWLKLHADGPGHHYSLDDCRAALRAVQPEDDGLDVERLAKALPDYLLDTENGILRRGPIAEAIAATYAAVRLSELSEGAERRDGA